MLFDDFLAGRKKAIRLTRSLPSACCLPRAGSEAAIPTHQFVAQSEMIAEIAIDGLRKIAEPPESHLLRRRRQHSVLADLDTADSRDLRNTRSGDKRDKQRHDDPAHDPHR